MNKVLMISVLIFLAVFTVQAQHSEKTLEQIRQWFKEVNAKTSQYRKVEYADIQINKDINAERYSMEGEEIYRLGNVHMTKFFEGVQIVKIVVDFYGDRQDLTSEYYFKDNNLFFVDKIWTVYKKPKWLEGFKETERSTVKNRFYFKDDQLIRWINPEVSSVGKMDPAYPKHETKILNDSNLYSSIE